MKSIIEQASSIAKAVDKAWERAGKPADFSVKILELPESNFFGMNTKPAKIAVLFEEKQLGKRQAYRPQRGRTAHGNQNREREIQKAEKDILDSVSTTDMKKPVEQESRKKQPQKINKNVDKPQPAKLAPADDQKEKVDLWSDEMVHISKNWLQNVLTILGITNTFTMQASGRHLRIVFDVPVYEDEKKQRLLFSSFAYLIMETLRAQLKVDLRGARVVLESK